MSEWRTAFAANEIPGVAWGIVALRRLSAGDPGQIFTFEDVAWPGHNGGQALVEMLDGVRLLRGRTAADILDTLLVTAPELRLIGGSRRLGDPGKGSAPSVLERESGIGIRVRADQGTVALLERLVTPGTPRNVAAASKNGSRADRLMNDIKRLVQCGFLLPVNPCSADA